MPIPHAVLSLMPRVRSPLLALLMFALAGPDSLSFLPALKGGTSQRPPIVMQSGSSGLMTIRSGRWKPFEGLGSGGFSQPVRITAGPFDPPGQLYDLVADPAETTNRFADEPGVVERLLADMRSIVDAGRRR